jgi:hypothetical protein
MFCEDLRADGVTLTEPHKADLLAVNVVAQTSILRSSNTKGVLMTEHANYPFFPENIHFWYQTKRAFGASSYGASECREVMWTWESGYGIFSGSTLRTAVLRYTRLAAKVPSAPSFRAPETTVVACSHFAGAVLLAKRVG